jgi:hypothetical protein
LAFRFESAPTGGLSNALFGLLSSKLNAKMSSAAAVLFPTVTPTVIVVVFTG